MLHSKIKIDTKYLDGQTIEIQIARAMSVNEPIDSSSPLQFTKRADGVLPDFDIRTDKWEIAQNAMTAVADKIRQNRTKKLQELTKSNENVPAPPASQNAPTPSSTEN